MFDITPTKTFMDSVHGYVNIPKCFVDHIINTELFQRLRNIDQTGMRILYPDAKHDRFGHSLGVFHLGNKAVDALLSNFSDEIYWKISSDNKKAIFWAKNKMLFLLACLLHDIGHVPFSHSLEEIVLRNSAKSDQLFAEVFCEKFNSLEKEKEKLTGVGNAAPHEILGGMLIMDKMKANISAIYDELISAGYPQDKDEHVLYAEHYQSAGAIDKTEIDSDICFVVRMITGLKYQGYEPEKQIRNCFIELLNGGNFDVDKLDYIVRDTQMSGISNITIDIERLLKSVCIVQKTRCVGKEFQNKDYSDCMIHSLKDFNGHEFRIKGNFSGTLIFEENTEIHIAKDSTFTSLIGRNEETKIEYLGEQAKFYEETKINREGLPINKAKEGMLTLPLMPNDDPFKVVIQDAKVASDNGFQFKVYDGGCIVLNVKGYCDITMKGKWKADSAVSFYNNTTISGVVQQIDFMGNMIKENLPTSNEYNTFSVGFKKQALNIIANVLEARDYLYLWVYAHHKVIYYANYLIPVLSNELLPIKDRMGEQHFPTWNLNYNDIANLDDAYIWTVIKYFRNLQPEPIEQLCAEMLSRNYKSSLYKSLAEYELLFEEFSDLERFTIRRHLVDAIDKSKPCVMSEGEIIAGNIGENVVEKIKEYGDISDVSCLVFVDANYKPKKINTHETYIIMQDESISVSKIPLIANRRILSSGKETKYFYLYYGTYQNALGDKNRLIREIKNAIKKYLKAVMSDDIC